MDLEKQQTIRIEREPQSQEAFDKLYRIKEQKQSLFQKLKNKVECSGSCCWNFFSALIPILQTIRYYNIRCNIASDLISGIACGLFHIPNALSFALLAKVGIQNGLYTSFWTVFLYAIFGSTAQVSVGTSLLASAYTGNIIDRQYSYFNDSDRKITLSNVTILEHEDYEELKRNTASGVALLTGIILLVFSILKASFLADLLSCAFIKAFTSGLGVHVIILQIPRMLSLHLKPHGGIFKLGFILKEIFEGILDVHGLTVVISVLSLAGLILFKWIIRKRLFTKLSFPVPIELVVIILGIAITAPTQLKHKVDVVGPLPSTIARPRVPNLAGSHRYIMDCFILAILLLSSNTSVSRVITKKHNKRIDFNQELKAQGIGNFVASFFNCFPSSVMSSRSKVLSMVGAKTTFCGLFTAVTLLIFVIISSYIFEFLPITILSVIIVVSTKPLILQIADGRTFWNVSKYEFTVWLVTLLCSVFLDLNYGFLIGFGLSIVMVVIQTQLAKGYRLSKTVEDKVIVRNKIYYNAIESPGIRIFRFESNIYFATAEIFKNKLYRQTVNPCKLLKFIKKEEKKLKRQMKHTSKENGDIPMEANRRLSTVSEITSVSLEYEMSIARDTEQRKIRREHSEPNSLGSAVTTFTNLTYESEIEDSDDGEQYISGRKFEIMRKVHHVIIDFSSVNYVDFTGASMLRHIVSEYADVNITVYIVNCSSDVLKTLRHCGILENILHDKIFLDVHDGVAIAKIEDRLNMFKIIQQDLEMSDDGKF